MPRLAPCRCRLPFARLVAGALLLSLSACIPPVDLMPDDAGVPPEEGVVVAFGVGVELKEVDGEPVRKALRVRVAPGRHAYLVHVRRSYRKVRDEMAGVYAVGVCEVVIDGEPRDEFEIRTYLASEVDRTGYRRTDPLGSTYTTFNIGLYTDDHTRDRVRAEPCNLRMDCRALDTRRMSPSSECTYEPFPPE